jgi:hypothetical protein
MFRKIKLPITGEHLAARYNWCQGPVPGSGPAVEKHCLTGFLICHWRQDRQSAARNFQMHLRHYSGFCWVWRKDACHIQAFWFCVSPSAVTIRLLQHVLEVLGSLTGCFRWLGETVEAWRSNWMQHRIIRSLYFLLWLSCLFLYPAVTTCLEWDQDGF